MRPSTEGAAAGRFPRAFARTKPSNVPRSRDGAPRTAAACGVPLPVANTAGEGEEVPDDDDDDDNVEAEDGVEDEEKADNGEDDDDADDSAAWRPTRRPSR